jgi:hypothetical protein
MSSATFHTASMSVQVVSCGEVLKAKRMGPGYVRRLLTAQVPSPEDESRWEQSRRAVVGRPTIELQACRRTVRVTTPLGSLLRAGS